MQCCIYEGYCTCSEDNLVFKRRGGYLTSEETCDSCGKSGLPFLHTMESEGSGIGGHHSGRLLTGCCSECAVRLGIRPSAILGQ